ncbi:hypothetical protein N0V90_003850 [Kalmusia sp. IMI 367209]|nr:hypothetical protein N0V90_003850 [Kalmusia sp. IMI 367209]
MSFSNDDVFPSDGLGSFGDSSNHPTAPSQALYELATHPPYQVTPQLSQVPPQSPYQIEPLFPQVAAQSPYARLYADVVCDLDSPFANFLKSVHGVSGTSTVKTGSTLGLGAYPTIAEANATTALHMLSQESSHPFFQDDWARALTYRYHPLDEATATQRADSTIVEIIESAEECIGRLYNAMLNVESVHNKPTSIELEMFKSPRLDKKAVEAACRSILTALIHRCVVGFCGLRTSANPSREDKKLTCKERLTAVISALKVMQVIFDKRICKDVMTEDSKINFLVHGPLAVTKCKQSQEKGNDVKRGLLSAGAAARRNRVSEPSSIGESHEGSAGSSSSPAANSFSHLVAEPTAGLFKGMYLYPALPSTPDDTMATSVKEEAEDGPPVYVGTRSLFDGLPRRIPRPRCVETGGDDEAADDVTKSRKKLKAMFG